MDQSGKKFFFDPESVRSAQSIVNSWIAGSISSDPSLDQSNSNRKIRSFFGLGTDGCEDMRQRMLIQSDDHVWMIGDEGGNFHER